jgi:hypothetical protein
MVERIRRELLASVPLTLVLAAALGVGLIHLLVDLLDQRAALSLEALMVALVHLVAPLAVTLLWICCCAPLRVGEAARPHPRGARWELASGMATAAACTTLLIPYFLGAAMLAGALATAVPDPLRQLPPLLALLTPQAMVKATLHGAGLAAVSAWLCARQGRRCRQRPEELPRRIAAATVEAILAILALEALLAILMPPNLPPIG